MIFIIYMTNFISPLYIADKNLEARILYEKIKKLITSRLDQLISAKNESNSEYVNSLSSQELNSFENLINYIIEFENENYLENELSEYNKYLNQL